MAKKLTKEEFIEKAKLVHGSKYDYSKVEYINSYSKVCIICPEHGEFWQTPKDNLRGCGCPKCALNKRTNKRRKNINYFISEVKKVHDDKYDYSKVDYNNANTNIIIICPEHGEFKQIAHNHLRGQGCPKCANSKKGDYQKSNTEDFIKKAKLVHGNKYDYSKVNYINNRIKVCIICPEHGDFFQKPLDHTNGRGCIECGKKFGISERKILSELKKNYNNIIYQYRPQWLYNKTSPQSLDFYIPDYNIAIEYQGRQHFYPNKIFGGDKEFIKIQERDKRKYQKCLENNVKIFYISFEKNVPENYFAPIYKTIENLIKTINSHIKK